MLAMGCGIGAKHALYSNNMYEREFWFNLVLHWPCQ